MDEKTLKALCRCPLFAGMEPAEIEIALSGAGGRLVSYPRQEVYVLAGMPCRSADIVVEGTLIARMSSLSGKHVEVSRLRSGNIVAPAFFFAKDNKMPVSVETAEPTTVFRLRIDVLKQLIDSQEKIRWNFLHVLSNIDVFLTNRMKVLTLFTVREKIVSLILQRSREQHTNEVTLLRSRQQIADSFGIQKFSVQRVLNELEQAGAIAIDGKKIRIIDRSKML